MIVIGTRFFTWLVGRTAAPWQCGRCGTVASFLLKKGVRFLTLFFIIPVLPLSGTKHLAECPRCGARYAIPPPAPADLAPPDATAGTARVRVPGARR